MTISKSFSSIVAALLLAAPVFAEQGPKTLEGQPAPTFELPATQIEKVLPDKKEAKTLSLAELKGKNVVLFFYPKALTKGCTTESCGFRDAAPEFAKLDTVLVGISNDTLAKQQEFTDKNMLPYPLFADTEKKVTSQFHVLASKGFPLRTTFVIDKKGVVRKVYDKVDPAKHPAEVLEFVKTQLSK